MNPDENEFDDLGSEDVSGMIEDFWDGKGSWIGSVEVAYGPTADGDAIFTLPDFAMPSISLDGTQRDVAMPLALLRWVVERAPRPLETPDEASR